MHSGVRRIAALTFVLLFLFGGCVTRPDGISRRKTPGGAEGLPEADTNVAIDRRLEEMTLREKLGQRFLIYVPRDGGITEEYVTLLKRTAPAGMIVYPWNYRDRDALINLTAKLQRLAAYHPAGGNFLIAADQEGGRVAAYRFPDLPRFPSAAAMARQATVPHQAAAAHQATVPHQAAAAQQATVPGPADSDESARSSPPSATSSEPTSSSPSDVVPDGSPRHSAVDDNYLYSQGYITGRDLRSLGININFAPVVDLVEVQDRSIIGDRSWGGDPDRVSAMARSYLAGLREAGVIGTVKHFPGHGVTRVDSHGRLPEVDLTIDDLMDRDLRPFIAAVDGGVPAVMTAHILFPRIDPEYPVTISEVFLHDILRERLQYDGVVLSDGLSMAALSDNYDIDLVLERALKYDVDLILIHDRYDFTEILARTEALVASGRITEEDIDRGVRRVLALKERYRLF